jgi:hypothetical protein
MNTLISVTALVSALMFGASQIAVAAPVGTATPQLGAALEAASSPLAGVNVALHDVLGKVVATAISDRNGMAVFPAVAPGSYSINARIVLPQTQATNLNSSRSNVKIVVGNTPLPDVTADLSAGKTHTSKVTVTGGAAQPITFATTVKSGKSNSSDN